MYVNTAFTCMSAVSVTVRHAYVTHGLLSAEWGKYNGGGCGWSLWLLHTWKGGLVFKFHSSAQLRGKVADLTFVFPPASHGAQSATVKLLSPGSLRPALLPPGLRWYLGTRWLTLSSDHRELKVLKAYYVFFFSWSQTENYLTTEKPRPTDLDCPWSRKPWCVSQLCKHRTTLTPTLLWLHI